MEKSFLICDDKSEKLFVGRLIRTDNQLNEHVKKLEIGEEYPLSKTRFLVREK